MRWFGVAVVIMAIAVAGCGTSPMRDPAPTLTVAGYVVPWDARSLAAVGWGAVTAVSPVWFQPTDDGGLVYASPEAEASVAAVAKEASSRDLDVVPSISNFRNGSWDGALIRTIITDPGLRERHIAAIVDLARSHGWPGIDLDYESLPATSRAVYSTFVRELATALHGAGARLSVTVHAKTSEPGGWSGAQAQDWRALGESADQIRVMAYDYSSANSPPGTIAPRRWVDQVVKLAVALVAPDRVVLGVGTYGYDWTAGESDGVAVQWADVQDLVRNRGGQERWDAETASPSLQYTDGQGRRHVVWYESARSLSAKIDIARHYGVTQVVLWRLGGEDPGIWNVLRSAR